MAALKRSTHIDRTYCGGNLKWRFVGKYSCSFKVSILNHFLRTWKPTITTSFTIASWWPAMKFWSTVLNFYSHWRPGRHSFGPWYSIWHCFIKMCEVSLKKGGPKLNLSPGIPFRKKTAKQEQQWVQFDYRTCYWMLLYTYIILCLLWFSLFLGA